MLGGESHRDTLAMLKTAKGKGDTSSFLVEPDARVVGIYGYMDGKGDVRGFGFLTVTGI